MGGSVTGRSVAAAARQLHVRQMPSRVVCVLFGASLRCMPMQGCFSFDALSRHVFRLRQSEGPKKKYFRVSPPVAMIEGCNRAASLTTWATLTYQSRC